ncbi:glycosyltransferase family 2 protein [Pseudoalteromonas xiamenensis]|uniref:glycosyltransferase family 2 protein n=1 Tax=Pseudoalteromonas xiamenensis TaxID=882626 RepID=UPI0035EE1150
MKISVIIPLYNKASYIRRTLESIFAQTVPVFEIIVIDDGSTDNGVEIVESGYVNDVKLLRHDSNQGVSTARNTGIKAASGDFIAFLDADDYWQPQHVSVLYQLRQKYPQANVLCAGYEFYDGLSHRAFRNMHLPKDRGVIDDYFKACCHADLPITASSVCVAKTSLDAIGLFPVDIALGEDQIVWAKLACSETVAFDASLTVVYDLSASRGKEFLKDKTLPSPHTQILTTMLESGAVPDGLHRSLEYLLHLTILNCVKRNLQTGNKKYAFELLRKHELLCWDKYRVLAFLCLMLPTALLNKVFSYARNFR